MLEIILSSRRKTCFINLPVSHAHGHFQSYLFHLVGQKHVMHAFPFFCRPIHRCTLMSKQLGISGWLKVIHPRTQFSGALAVLIESSALFLGAQDRKTLKNLEVSWVLGWYMNMCFLFVPLPSLDSSLNHAPYCLNFLSNHLHSQSKESRIHKIHTVGPYKLYMEL